MNGYRIELDCRECGGPVESVNEGQPVAGAQVSAVARCCDCGRQWLVRVQLMAMSRQPARSHA